MLDHDKDGRISKMEVVKSLQQIKEINLNLPVSRYLEKI
jgi:Ca2+-binding EF-hand superfamily protein